MSLIASSCPDLWTSACDYILMTLLFKLPSQQT
jgi:hypothetical protein